MAVGLVALVAAGPALGEPGLLDTRGGGDSPFGSFLPPGYDAASD